MKLDEAAGVRHITLDMEVSAAAGFSVNFAHLKCPAVRCRQQTRSCAPALKAIARPLPRSLQLAGQNETVMSLMTVPADYLDTARMSPVGLVLAHGGDADDWRAPLLEQLAARFAAAGHVVMRYFCPLKEQRRHRILEKAFEVARTSPYATAVSKWVFVGYDNGARIAAGGACCLPACQGALCACLLACLSAQGGQPRRPAEAAPAAAGMQQQRIRPSHADPPPRPSPTSPIPLPPAPAVLQWVARWPAGPLSAALCFAPTRCWTRRRRHPSRRPAPCRPLTLVRVNRMLHAALPQKSHH